MFSDENKVFKLDSVCRVSLGYTRIFTVSYMIKTYPIKGAVHKW